MKWVSTLRETKSCEEAIDQMAQHCSEELRDGIDLAFLFVSPYFRQDYDKLSERVYDQLRCRVLIGCSAGGVIGGGYEIESRPAISVLAASLPDVEIKPFHLNQSDLPGLDASPKKWQDCFKSEGIERPQFVLLADPFTLDAEMALQGLDYAYPDSVKVGGLASGAGAPGQTGLFVNRNYYRSGMVGVELSGKLEIDTIVSQGCRPIGKPLSITRCEKNLLIEIDRKKPLDVIQDLYHDLPEMDQNLMRHSLFLGIAMTPFKEHLERGDFLIRNLMGIDYQTGALAVGSLLREGQTIQFHLRDRETSAEDLNWHLTQYQMEREAGSACGALLFSCMGRGVNLYGEPDFDTRLFRNLFGDVPLGGFFCNGEIGAVGQTTFLHGYTSCMGIFRSTP